MSIILCLDLGIAHTGLAISHEGVLAEPLTTIFETNRRKLISKILPHLTEHHPDTIVIGLPNHGLLVEHVNNLKNELEKVFAGKIILFPEDFSSRSAQSLLKDTGKILSKRKAAEHQTAAAIILEDYLDSL